MSGDSSRWDGGRPRKKRSNLAGFFESRGYVSYSAGGRNSLSLFGKHGDFGIRKKEAIQPEDEKDDATTEAGIDKVAGHYSKGLR